MAPHRDWACSRGGIKKLGQALSHLTAVIGFLRRKSLS